MDDPTKSALEESPLAGRHGQSNLWSHLGASPPRVLIKRTFPGLPTELSERERHISFSVVIPCRDGLGVPKAVQSLLEVDYPPELFEIIVVRGSNPSLQRNRGAQLANGDVVAFTDDDCKVPANWLSVASDCFDDENMAIVGGPNLTPPSDPPLAMGFGLVCSSSIATSSMSRRYRKAKPESDVDETVLALSNLFCRRSLFDSGLHFSPLLFPNEENHFMNGASRLGHGMSYTPDLYVYHPRKRTWAEFFRQFMGYGTGRGKQTRMDPRSLSPIHLAPATFSLAVVSSPLLAVALPVILPILLLLVSVYLMVIGAESIRLGRCEEDLVMVPHLMASFFVLHFAYGLGIIVGLLSKNGKVRGKDPTDEDVTFFYPA